MTREKIEGELRTHREKLARLAVLRENTVEIEHKIQELRTRNEDPSGVGAAVIDGMPHTQSTSSVVERQTIKRDKDTDEIIALQYDLDRLQTQAYILGREVAIVEAWLSALDEPERLLVEMFYLDDLTWSMSCQRYERAYNTTMCERQAKRIRSDALEKMERVSG
jgi:DNA-directed RNA polymerase specialized sigma subunit